MRNCKYVTLVVCCALCLSFTVGGPSQTVILPSKKDIILQKLDQVLQNQKDIQKRLEKIERRVGPGPEKGPRTRKSTERA